MPSAEVGMHGVTIDWSAEPLGNLPRDHGAGEEARSTVDREHARQAGTSPVVAVGGRICHVDHERLCNRSGDQVRAEHHAVITAALLTTYPLARREVGF